MQAGRQKGRESSEAAVNGVNFWLEKMKSIALIDCEG